jgi:hypothetical protein
MITVNIRRSYEARIGTYKLHLVHKGIHWIARLSQAPRDNLEFRKVVGRYPRDTEVIDLKKRAETDARAELAQKADPAADAPISQWRALADPNQRHRNMEARMQLELESQKAREEQLLKKREFISNYIVVLTLLGTLAGTVFFFYSSRSDKTNIRDTQAIVRVQDQMSQLSARYEALLKSFKQQTPTTEQDKAISAIRADLDNVRQRVTDFEAAIGDDAPKRIAVVTLRKEIDTIKDEHHADIVALREEYTRLLDFLKWVVGIIAASGILSTIFTFFSKPKEIKSVEDAPIKA